MRMVRNTKAGKITLWTVLVAVLILGVSACGGDESSTEPASTEPASPGSVSPEPEATQTAAAEPVSVDLDVVAGSYEASYEIEGQDGTYPASFVIAPGGAIEGEGEMKGGWEFSISGSVSESGEFAAAGEVEGTTQEISWSGTFDTSVEPITISGTWNSESLRGSWSAEQQ